MECMNLMEPTNHMEVRPAALLRLSLSGKLGSAHDPAYCTRCTSVAACCSLLQLRNGGRCKGEPAKGPSHPSATAAIPGRTDKILEAEDRRLPDNFGGMLRV